METVDVVLEEEFEELVVAEFLEFVLVILVLVIIVVLVV